MDSRSSERSLRRAFAGCLLLVVGGVGALALAGAARADPLVGVSDDGGKYADDGGVEFFSLLRDGDLRANRMTVLWDPADPFRIGDQGFLDRSLPIAASAGVEVMFAVYPATANAFAVQTQARIAQFAEFLALLARTYPTVKTYIVGNEPNQPRFFQPQFVRSRSGYRAVAGATYAHVLAAAYDALKGVDRSMVVAGLGLSARGNDDPAAKSNISRSPVRFLHDLAGEYRRSGRREPLMDTLAFHPYPAGNTAPLLAGYSWPNAGVADLDRIKQAIWDGFHGTAQPVFPEPGLRDGRHSLRLILAEYGLQVAVRPELEAAYHGTENVRTISEERQAQQYHDLIEHVECDPTVDALLFFGLVDNDDLDRFQSGLLRVDKSPRPAYTAVQQTLASGGCQGSPASWRHSSSVAGLRVRFTRTSARIDASEEAFVTAACFPAGTTRQTMLRRLTGKLDDVSTGRPLGPGRRVTLSLRRLVPETSGRYVAAVLVAAALNPQRSRLVSSRPFVVTRR